MLARKADYSTDAGDIDDRPTVTFVEVGCRLLRATKCATKVDIEGNVVARLIDIFGTTERCRQIHPSVVHNDVDTTEGVGGLLEQRFDVTVIGRVSRN